MKRHGELYEKIYNFSNLENAYRKARRNKRYRAEVLRYTQNLEENFINLQNHLIWKTYKQGKHHKFTVTEPKTRLISALPFRDRVAQHAINNVIEPLFDRRFFYHSYACRKGKGMHKASETLGVWIRNMTYQNRPLYALKMDVQNFFHTIDHGRLKQALRRVIKDADALWLLDTIIDDGGADGRGIPIGNLTSQLFANIYLDALDRFVKEDLRARHYIRYMDDFVILSFDVGELRQYLAKIEAFLFDRLALRLNPKTAIIAAKNGIDFCGYRHFADHKKVRRRSVKHMESKIKAYYAGRVTLEGLVKSFVSWQGHISHADTYHLRKNIISKLPPNVRAEFEYE